MAFPDLVVDVGFTTTAPGTAWHIGDAARGKIGTASIGPDELWTDVTDWVHAVNTNRGVNRAEAAALRYEAGTCEIDLDNSDRRFDPTNLAGPYVSGGVTQVTPMRPVRIRATWAGVTYDVFRGFADSWKITYPGPNTSQVKLTATDATKVLVAYSRPESAPVGAGEDSGARVSRILDSAGWPAGDRVISTGDTTVQATTLEGSAWSELLIVQDTELGELYLDAAGRVVFRNRHGILSESRSNTSQGTFGDDGSELPYKHVDPDYDDETIVNLALITRVGGAVQTAEDVTSQADYLVHAHTRTDLVMESDAEALQYAQWIVNELKDPELRFSTIQIFPRRGDPTVESALFVQALARLIGDRIAVVRRPPGGGDPIEQECFVRGIRHEVRPDQWTTTFTLQSASRYSFWTIGHPTLGQIGTVNALAF